MSVFKFKYFDVVQINSAMKVGTDSMILGAFLEHTGCKTALDIGSGTGVLSLMLAQVNREVKITAIDVEESAFLETQQNFQNASFSNEFNAILGDFLQVSFHSKFDLIFSNPPFYNKTYLSEDKKRNLARHGDSFTFEALFLKVSTLLNAEGIFQLIVPSTEKDKLISLAEENNLHLVKVIEVYAKIGILNRVILTFSMEKDLVVKREFILRNVDNSYSKEYIVLTKEFHFNSL